MQDFVWCTVLHYTHIQNCNNSKAWNSLLLETFMEGCRCSLLLLSQRIHLDQWPGPAGFCWMEATARACPATICAESWQFCRSNQKTREINHWQRFAVCGFHNIFSPSSTPITTNFFLQSRTAMRKMFCCSLGLFLCSAALRINFFILSLTLVSTFLHAEFSYKILNFFRPSPRHWYQRHLHRETGGWKLSQRRVR